METIKKFEEAINEKGCRVIVEVNPKKEYIPKEYEKYSNEDRIIKFCKDFIDCLDAVPAITIQNTEELSISQLEEIEEYAGSKGLLVVRDIPEDVNIFKIMNAYKQYSYGEKKWQFVTRRVLQREIEKIKAK